MKKLWIEPGCITCGTCEYIAPEVFTVTDISHINSDADVTLHEDAIKKAIDACPVNVICYKKTSE
ncbi:MAG: ferredoxin [Candidatus Babeliaceae bacterium]|jgi:ferredoxin